SSNESEIPTLTNNRLRVSSNDVQRGPIDVQGKKNENVGMNVGNAGNCTQNLGYADKGKRKNEKRAIELMQIQELMIQKGECSSLGDDTDNKKEKQAKENFLIQILIIHTLLKDIFKEDLTNTCFSSGFQRHFCHYLAKRLNISHQGKPNVVADAWSRNERIKLRRVRALSMTIHSRVKEKILEAQSVVFENANTPAEMLQGLDKQFERKEDGRLYFADHKMYYDLRDLYWWPGMKKHIAAYVSKCLTCLEWKWENIFLDFVMKLPGTSSEHDAIWVIVDRLTKSVHFLVIHEDYKMEKLARLYLNEIVARHSVPVSIVSDRDSMFT
nr:putative reverse transcriptase domain-containing protein [Tanacetum cinerariifolium]